MPPAVASAAICHAARRRRLSSTCSSTFHMRLCLLPCCAVFVLCLCAARPPAAPSLYLIVFRWRPDEYPRHTVLVYSCLYILTCEGRSEEHTSELQSPVHLV